ncbi:putative GCN5-like N-acetyltransferase [Defluviitoga tunisiensis]|uniref:Putative GCN5-like N-acetyltransferase n=2 Tax=Defluviitoga tunisiensis TaxID=1006576 RepID=A0A0C7NI53_DEFTU|nr:putative GCN5-like N-acetyltransferase [Defluviitoga tunisiensis]
MVFTKLELMIKEEFEIYKNKMYDEYAKVLSENLLLPYHESLARAESQIDAICGDDEKNGKNYAYNIINEGDEQVGRMWVFVNNDRKKAFVYDIRIFPKYLRKGYATMAIKELEKKLKNDKVKKIGLNVFSSNKAAYNLYKKLGFTETYIILIKGYDNQKFITLPRYLKFLQGFFESLNYRVVAVEMRKKIE